MGSCIYLYNVVTEHPPQKLADLCASDILFWFFNNTHNLIPFLQVAIITERIGPAHSTVKCNRRVNFTASQTQSGCRWSGRRLTAWTSREGFCERDGEAFSDRRDRVFDVAFGTDRRRLGVDNRRVGEASCAAGRLR